jgi:hypothetical protein
MTRSRVEPERNGERMKTAEGRRSASAPAGHGGAQLPQGGVDRGGGSLALPDAEAGAAEPPDGLRIALLQERGELADGGRVEEGHHVDDLPQLLLETVDEHRPLDRVAAEREEVVVPPHPFQPQELPPHRGEALLDGGRRLLESRFLLQLLGGHSGQRLAVDLAARRQWKGREDDQRRRHQGLGQLLVQEGAQLGGSGRSVGRRHRVGDELQRSGGRPARHDHGLAHRRMAAQGRLDLAELDADAADLHLMVEAAQVLDRAVRTEAREIARLVEAPAGLLAQRIRNEALGGQLRARQVAAGELDAADVQLAGDADGDGIETAVEEDDRGVGDRASDRHGAPPAVPAAGVEGDVHRRFGRPVEVVQLRRRQAVQEALLKLEGQRLAAREDPAHALARRFQIVGLI